MERWKKVRLGEVIETNNASYSVKENWPFVNYLDTGNITENVIGEIQYIDIKKSKLPSRAKRKVRHNSIVYSMVRPNQRHYGIVKSQPENFLVSTGFTVVDVKEDYADADFIYFLLTQRDVVQGLHAIAEQSVSAYPSIKASDIENLEVMLPPIDEQRKIASILKTLSEKIIHNTRINHILIKQIQVLFKEWFIDNPETSKWQRGFFSDLLEALVSGDWGKESPSGNNTEMVYCIRGADIPAVRVGSKSKIPTRYILPKSYAAKQLADGDIVVEISGGSPTQSTGRAAVISTALLDRYDKGMVCTNFCKVLKPISGYGMFVYYYWQYFYDKGAFFSYENGTTGIKNLDISGFIKTEPIVIAPVNMVDRFNSVCQSITAKIYANGLENDQLASIRDTFLPKLMSGEIDVSTIWP